MENRVPYTWRNTYKTHIRTYRKQKFRYR